LLLGGLLLVVALVCFVVLDTTTKWVTQTVPPLMALWVLFGVQSLVSLGHVASRRGLATLRSTRLKWHVLRGTLLLAVQGLAFFSLKYLPVGEFTAMAMTTPLMVTLLASRILGEHVSLYRLLLVGGGLAGTLIIVRPGSGAFGWAVLLPMGLVLFNTAYQLLTSRMARSEDAVNTQAFTCITAFVCLTLLLPWIWAPVPDLQAGLGLLLMGVAASTGNLLFILAFERAPAATLTPYMYLQIGLGILAGWLVFSHVPDAQSVLGMALITACGVAGAVLTLHERHRTTVAT
jgi:drug/metabolite transporter (DMT)-like permease